MFFGVPSCNRQTDLYRPRLSERGAAMAEFAFVVPILMTMLFGIIEFGIAFNRVQAVEGAAREGARLASISSSDVGAIETRAQASLAGIDFDPGDLTIIVRDGDNNEVTGGNHPCQYSQFGKPVSVDVVLKHNITVPFVDTWQLDLTGQAVFRCEA